MDTQKKHARLREQPSVRCSSGTGTTRPFYPTAWFWQAESDRSPASARVNGEKAMRPACAEVGIVRSVAVDGRFHETDVEADRRGRSRELTKAERRDRKRQEAIDRQGVKIKIAMTGAERARNFRARRAKAKVRKAKAARVRDRAALLLEEFPNEMAAYDAYVKSGCLRMPSFKPTKLKRPTLAQLTAEPRAIGQREANRLKKAQAERPASSVGIAQREPDLLPRVATPPAKRRKLLPAAARSIEYALALADRIERTPAREYQHRSNYNFESAAVRYTPGEGYPLETRAPSPREYTPRPRPITGNLRDLITREDDVPRENWHHAPADETPDQTGEEYSTDTGTAAQLVDQPDAVGESTDAYHDPTGNPTPEPDPVVRTFVELRAATEPGGIKEQPDDTSGDIDDDIDLPSPPFCEAVRSEA